MFPSIDPRIQDYLESAARQAEHPAAGLSTVDLMRRGFPTRPGALLSQLTQQAIYPEVELLSLKITQMARGKKKPGRDFFECNEFASVEEISARLGHVLSQRVHKRLCNTEKALQRALGVNQEILDRMHEGTLPYEHYTPKNGSVPSENEKNQKIEKALLPLFIVANHSLHPDYIISESFIRCHDYKFLRVIAFASRAMRCIAREEALKLRKEMGIPIPAKDNLEFIKERGMVFAAMSRNRSSWGEIFYEIVYKAIDEDMLNVVYDNHKTGSPNVPPARYLCALFLKAYLGMTSYKALIIRLKSDREMRKAIGLDPHTEDCFTARSLRNFEKRNEEKGPERLGFIPCDMEMHELNCYIAKVTEVDCSRVRMDSTSMRSGADLSRLELINRVNRNMLKRMHCLGFQLSLEWQQYLLKDGDSALSSSYQERVQAALERSLQILKEATANGKRRSIKELSHLSRLIKEQMKMDEDGNMVAIPGREISAQSLQNPSAPKATYRIKGDKKWVGHTINFVEAYDSTARLSLIIDFDVQPNSYSDVDFGKDFVNKLLCDKSLSNLGITKVVADGAYHSSNAIQQAKENGIQFHPTKTTGRKKKGEEKQIKSPEANYRAGVEGIAAEFRRAGVDRIPVRCMVRVKRRLGAMTVGYNIRQFLSYGERLAKQQRAS